MLIQLGQFIINQIFPYNIGLQKFCDKNQGKVLLVALSDIDTHIAAYIHNDGIYMKNYTHEAVSASMTTTLQQLAPFILKHKTNLNMEIDGDINIFEQIQSLIRTKPLNLSAWLHDNLGLTLGTIVYESIITIEKQIDEMLTHARSDTTQYLRSEQDYFVVQEDLYTIEKQLQKLDFDIDRLKFRIDKLMGNTDD